VAGLLMYGETENIAKTTYYTTPSKI